MIIMTMLRWRRCKTLLLSSYTPPSRSLFCLRLLFVFMLLLLLLLLSDGRHHPKLFLIQAFSYPRHHDGRRRCSTITASTFLSRGWTNNPLLLVGDRTTRNTKSLTSTMFASAHGSGGVEQQQQEIRGAIYQSPQPQPSFVVNKKENPLEILTQIVDALRVASIHNVDIVVFPELFLTGGPPLLSSPSSSSFDDNSSLDRESSQLNIIGNICSDLNVACIIGYKESMEKNQNDDDINKEIIEGAYNSIAVFNADGSRAGNYRSCYGGDSTKTTSSSDFSSTLFRKGNPFIETIPISIQLPIRPTSPSSSSVGGTKTTTTTNTRELKVGVLCGNDVLVPEHCRHLVRNGSQMLAVAASYQKNDNKILNHVVTTRSIENQVPILVANYMGSSQSPSSDNQQQQQQQEIPSDDADDINNNSNTNDYIGSSVIISQDGDDLVRGPTNEMDDMPYSDTGYLLPCDVDDGILYAADIFIRNTDVDDVVGKTSNNNNADGGGGGGGGDERSAFLMIQNSIEQWDLSPRICNDVMGVGVNRQQSSTRGDGSINIDVGKKHDHAGFGRKDDAHQKQQKSRRTHASNKRKRGK